MYFSFEMTFKRESGALFSSHLRYLINLHINGFERSVYRFFVNEDTIKKKISEILNLKLNELAESIRGMSLADMI
jgi:hypothetical protein